MRKARVLVAEKNRSKGDIVFCAAPNISAQKERLEKELLAPLTPCAGLPLDEVCERIARIHAELLLIHPFREGNGRVARWVATLMAHQAGLPTPKYPLKEEHVDQEREIYFAALRKGYFDM